MSADKVIFMGVMYRQMPPKSGFAPGLRKLNGDSGSVAGNGGMGGGCHTTRAPQSAHPDCSLDPLASQLGNNTR